MKKYIGREEISATPMTYGEAFKDGIIPPNAYVEELSEEAGYKIVGSDKSAGWLDKEVFEALYKVAETALDRVNIEASELKERTDKLGHFIFNLNDGKDYQSLPLGVRAFLMAQFHAMGSYLVLLFMRQSGMESDQEVCPSGLSFEQILPLLKEGFAIRRKGWNGRGLMVFKQVPAHIPSDVIPGMQSLPAEAKRLILSHGDHIDYVSQCLIFNSNTGEANSWVPSISDVFANDWELVVE